jgi:hypothetical protein
MALREDVHDLAHESCELKTPFANATLQVENEVQKYLEARTRPLYGEADAVGGFFRGLLQLMQQNLLNFMRLVVAGQMSGGMRRRIWMHARPEFY